MYAKWWAKYLTDKCLINVFIYPFKEEKDIYLPTQNLMRQHIHLIIIFQVIFLSPDMTNKVFFFFPEVVNCVWDGCFSEIYSQWVNILAYIKNMVPFKFHFSSDICAIYLILLKEDNRGLWKCWNFLIEKLMSQDVVYERTNRHFKASLLPIMKG